MLCINKQTDDFINVLTWHGQRKALVNDPHLRMALQVSIGKGS
jgi:hypothetical protein